MTAITDRPDLAERYGRALQSSHLEVLTDERCSVDMLIAAGWVDEGLGTALYRLRSEFDLARGQAVAATKALAAQQAQLDKARRAANQAPADDRLKAIAKHLADELDRTALTERAMVLVHLKSLDDTSQALGKFALTLAAREARGLAEPAVRKIAGRALDFWLDPLCMACHGTGAVGGYGEPRNTCTACNGTTKRPVRMGTDERGHQFGRLLLAAMDSKTDYVQGRMRAFLTNR